MNHAVRSLLFFSCIACLVASLSSCSSGGGEGAPPPASNTPQTVVSGTVQAPGGQVAFFKKNNLGDLFVSKAHAALTGLVDVPDSTIVQLARLNANATNFSVLTTTTTSGGRYSFNLTALGLEPASDLIVRVAGPGGKEMRAFVSGAVVDINPVSEAAYQLSTQALAGTLISNLTLQEVADISGSIGTATLLQNIGSVTSVDQAVTLVKTVAAANSAISNYIVGAIGPGQTIEGIGDIGNYLPLSQGNSWTYNGTKTETGQPTVRYVNTNTVSGAQIVNLLPTLVITSTNLDGDGMARDEYITKEASNLRVIGNSDLTDALSPLITPYSALHFPLYAGSTTQQLDKTDLSVDLDGDGAKETIAIKSSVSVPGFETLSVQAGTFTNTAKVVTTTTISASSTIRSFTVTQMDTTWLAPGIGIIKSQTAIHSEGTTISTIEELSSYDVEGRFRGSVPGAVINTGSFANTLAIPGKPAVATDGSGYLVVACTKTAPTQGLVGILVSHTGNLGTPFVIEAGECGSEIDDPNTAFDGTNYLVTYSHRILSDGYNRIRGKRISKTGAVLDSSPGILISLDTRLHRGTARVSSDGTNYMVVWWEVASLGEIVGARISRTGQNLGVFPITTSIVSNQENPKVAFDGSNYLVVWEDLTRTNYHDLYGTRISPAGAVLDHAGFPIATTVFDDTHAELAFDGTNYLVVWESIEPHSTFAYFQIHGMRISKSASLLDGPATGGGIVINAGNLPNQPLTGIHFPSIAFDGANYRVAWQSLNANSRIFGTKVSPSGQVTGAQPSPQGFPLSDESPSMTVYHSPRLVSSSSGSFLIWTSVYTPTKLSYVFGTNGLP